LVCCLLLDVIDIPLPDEAHDIFRGTHLEIGFRRFALLGRGDVGIVDVEVGWTFMLDYEEVACVG
jgi:hypothetical protein